MFFCVDLSIAHIISLVLLNWAQCSVEMQLHVFIVHVVLTCGSCEFLMLFCVDLSVAHIISLVLLNWAQCSVGMQLLGQLGVLFEYFLFPYIVREVLMVHVGLNSLISSVIISTREPILE